MGWPSPRRTTRGFRPSGRRWPTPTASSAAGTAPALTPAPAPGPGIKCVRGRVVALQLPWRGFGGRLSDKIAQLAALRKLSLHDNAIRGPIPPSLGSLRDLRGVYLFNNRFSGGIPPSIGACLLLQTLDLSHNLLTGRIPSSLSNSSRLIRLNLSYNNISGPVPVAITQISSLVFLLLQHNSLSGSVPDTWGSTVSHGTYQLQSLHLENNLLSGSIPLSLGRLQTLEDVSLSNNQLNGSIPQEITTLSRIKTLDLSANSIGGSFPASLCNLPRWSTSTLKVTSSKVRSRRPSMASATSPCSRSRTTSSVARSLLHSATSLVSLASTCRRTTSVEESPLPSSTSPISPSSMSPTTTSRGLFLFSSPASSIRALSLGTSSSAVTVHRFRVLLLLLLLLYRLSPSIHPTPIRRSLSPKNVILIAVGVFLALLLLLFCVFLVFLIKKRAAGTSKQSTATGGAAAAAGAGRDEKPGPAAGTETEAGGDTGGKLVHFDGPLAFTADDLLCATAEIMGKSTYGTVYKATLEDGSQVAVKRLREKIAKSQKEFEAEVNVLGKIRHQNLLALRAYYLGPKGEKLLVFDFMPKGSLAAFLHARGPDTPVDWSTRMKIAMGVTRGLQHLHVDLKMIHGNLTSSNLLLDDDMNARISDFGVSRLMTGAASSNVIATASALGYRAPELSKLKKANAKTDIYSLGVIVLELLTGKSPADAADGVDLPQWVASIVKEEWTNEVFDLELMKDATAGTATGDELLNTLKLALHCVDPSPAARPEAHQVLQQLEQIKPEAADAVASSKDEGLGIAATEEEEEEEAKTAD
ncbi:unnamed protein product [Musa textilis]